MAAVVRRFALLYVVPTLFVLAAFVAPLILGTGTLYTRDVFSSHYEMKVSQAEAMRRGTLPIIDPYRAGGQPLLGNPNAVPLYPDNLLYLVAHPLWALNAHFWIHLLLAPLAGFWLGRAWGLGRAAAWAVGASYATSGFFLSLFNLYNLVAGAALAPAFLGACLDARRGGRRWSWTAVGLLWALLLLAGDPFFAALALVLAAGALLLQASASPWRPFALRLAGTVALGTLVAAPMLVEFLRILPLSFRGYWQYSLEAALAQSWDPRSLLEWWLPFLFGEPDFTFWGMRFYGGNPPLLYSAAPGVLAFALVACAGRQRPRAALWAWAACGFGLFFALGAWNPLVRLLYHLPGASALRYPVKFWLAVALGGALLCGLGFERLEAGGRRRLGWALAALGFGYGLLFVLLSLTPSSLLEPLRSLEPSRLQGPVLELEVARWRDTCGAVLATLAALALCLRLAASRRELGGALLLIVHVTSQVLLLRPLYDSDDVAPYLTPPPALEAVPEDAVVVHGGYSKLFGDLPARPGLRSPIELFPDPRFFWLTRLHFYQLYPFSGVQWQRRYELNHSPEGLDSFFVISLNRAMQHMSDLSRVRILEASGVDLLLLDRELEEAARERVRLRGHYPGTPLDLFVYEIPGSAHAAQMVGSVRRAPHMNAALDLLVDPSFDPRTMVVLPGDGPELVAPPGAARIEQRWVEGVEATVRSAAGGVLVLQRAYLGIYRATVDGAETPTQVANLHRLAVAVPPGEHSVRVWVDRRPTRAAWLASLLATLLLATLLWRRPPPAPGEVRSANRPS